jgi:hypothetical protein
VGLGAEAFAWPALGLLGASLTAEALGVARLIGPGKFVLFVALSLAGPLALSLVHEKDRPARPRRGKGRLEPRHALVALVGLSIGCRLVLASIPHFESDPLWDHLYGPRLWSDAGRIFRPDADPLVFKSGLWQNLLLWGNGLLTGEKGLGLLEGQLFGQWLHVLGMGGAALALASLLGRLESDASWVAVALFAALSTRVLGWTAWLAKDDFGTALWTLSAIVMAVDLAARGFRDRRAAALLGVFAGAAVGSKYTAGLNLAAAGVILVGLVSGAGPRTRRAFAGAGKLAAAGFACACGPLLARNLLFVGNPVFPTLNGLFKSPWLGPSLASAMKVFEGQGEQDRLYWLARRLAWLGSHDPLSVLLPASLIALALLGKGRLRDLSWLFLPLLSLVLFLAVIGPPVGDDGTLVLRLLGAGHLLMGGFGVLALHRLARSLKASRVARQGLLIAVAAVACWQSDIPWGAVLVVPESVAATPYRVRGLASGGEAKAWLRLNLKDGEHVISLGDNQLYYVAHLDVVALNMDPRLERALEGATTPETLVEALAAERPRYLLDSHHFTRRYWTRQAALIDIVVAAHPEVVAYRGRSSYVVDFTRLSAVIERRATKGKSRGL